MRFRRRLEYRVRLSGTCCNVAGHARAHRNTDFRKEGSCLQQCGKRDGCSSLSIVSEAYSW